MSGTGFNKNHKRPSARHALLVGGRPGRGFSRAFNMKEQDRVFELALALHDALGECSAQYPETRYEHSAVGVLGDLLRKGLLPSIEEYLEDMEQIQWEQEAVALREKIAGLPS